MPDISMCKNSDCPLKKKCYRYMAIPEQYQSYAHFEPDKENKCDWFFEIGYRSVKNEKEID